jgi:hypothetical protein
MCVCALLLFLQSGSCSYGDSCKYAHVLGAKPGEDVTERLAAMEAAKKAAENGQGEAAPADANMQTQE